MDKKSEYEKLANHLYQSLTEWERQIQKSKLPRVYQSLLVQYIYNTKITLALLKMNRIEQNTFDELFYQQLHHIQSVDKILESILLYQKFINVEDKKERLETMAQEFKTEFFDFFYSSSIFPLKRHLFYQELLDSFQKKTKEYDDINYLLTVTGQVYPYLKKQILEEKEKEPFPSQVKINLGMKQFQKYVSENSVLMRVSDIHRHYQRLLELRDSLDTILNSPASSSNFMDQVTQSNNVKKKQLLKEQGILIH